MLGTIRAHIFNFYQLLFLDTAGSSLKDFAVLDSFISCVVTQDHNDLLVAAPSYEEVRKAVFGLSAQSFPGPDDFGGVFLSWLLGDYLSGYL